MIYPHRICFAWKSTIFVDEFPSYKPPFLMGISHCQTYPGTGPATLCAALSWQNQCLSSLKSSFDFPKPQAPGSLQHPHRTVYLMIWWVLWMHAYVYIYNMFIYIYTVYVCVHNYSIYIICIISVITRQSLYSNYILISYAIWVPHSVGHHVTSVRSSRAGNAGGVGCPRFGFKVA